jgi:hypothetical protein
LNKINMKVPESRKDKGSSLVWVYDLCSTAALSVLGCLPIGEANSADLDIATLMHSRWVAMAAVYEGKPVSLDFKEAASVAGHAGCNAYFGKLEIMGENSTRSARIEKGVLELLDAQGKVLWRFKPLA